MTMKEVKEQQLHSGIMWGLSVDGLAADQRLGQRGSGMKFRLW